MNQRHLLDLAAGGFDTVDFTEATLLFDPARVLPVSLAFVAWGATLLEGTMSAVPGEAPRAVTEHLYVAGYAILRFRGVCGGGFEAAIHDPGGEPEFVRTREGTNLKLTRRWAYEAAAEAKKYAFECCLAWPGAFCSLELQATGAASLEWDPADAVPVEAYVRDTKRYGWRPELEAGAPLLAR